jgi:DNA-binding transcriptional regulator GbsR (MarR family)
MNYLQRQGVMAQKRQNELKAPSKESKRDIAPAKQQAQQLRALASSVGDFIRYWGFRRIHGQLWTQIYLSKTPLSGAELVKNLQVSKALVSPALSELMKFNLITAIETDGRTKKYSANPEVFEVIQSILREREKKLIATALLNFEKLKQSQKNEHQVKFKVDEQRLSALGEMIAAANMALDFVIKSTESEGLSNWALVDEMISK